MLSEKKTFSEQCSIAQYGVSGCQGVKLVYEVAAASQRNELEEAYYNEEGLVGERKLSW